jgi:hypothetical protein
MKSISNLMIIVLLAIVFGQTRGFEHGMRGDILRAYRHAKEGRISSGEPKNLI